MPLKKLFTRVVLLEYPMPDCYTLAFVTSQVKGEISKKAGKSLLSVFIPIAPNPTQGQLIFIPETKVIELSMSVDRAICIIMSGGNLFSEKCGLSTEQFKLARSISDWRWWHKIARQSAKNMEVDPRD